MKGKSKVVNELRSAIMQADAIILQGLLHRGSRPFRVEEGAREQRDAANLLARAFELYKALEGNHPIYLRRIRELARYIPKVGEWEYALPLQEDRVSEEVRALVSQIAEIARGLGQFRSVTDKTRIREGRLFPIFPDEIYAAQIPNDRRGCSASLCTNCGEPVGYCTQVCPNCGWVFIGPFGFPEIEEWRHLCLSDKRRLAIDVYNRKNHGKLEVIPPEIHLGARNSSAGVNFRLVIA